MSKKIAVIDLGTNTFHLLIVEVLGPSEWITVDRERVFVNIASDGIDLLSEEAMERGLETMIRFRSRIRQFGSDLILAVGTAALRTAQNAEIFLHRVRRETGIEVSVISGDREAELIAKGVLTAIPELARPALIMDIGGGSVEMILSNRNEILFSKSFPVGVAVLYGQFHDEEPISAASIDRINAHLDHVFSPLLSILRKYPEVVLVGASGTFEVVESILDPRKDPDIPPFSTAKPADFAPIYQEIVGLDLEQRLAHPDIPVSRARYIVVAVQLIAYILQCVSTDIFFISAYAMKEGLVVEESNF